MCFCALDLKRYFFLFHFSTFFVHFVCFVELCFVLMQLNLAVFKGESNLNQTFLNRSSSMLDGKAFQRKKIDVQFYECIVLVCLFFIFM